MIKNYEENIQGHYEQTIINNKGSFNKKRIKKNVNKIKKNLMCRRIYRDNKKYRN